MQKQLIAATAIFVVTLSSAGATTDDISIKQEPKGSNAAGAAIGAGLGVGAGVGATAAALSAAGIAAVPHAAGGMILISTATGASYIAGTLGAIGGAVACVASVACAAVVVGGAALAVGGGYYAYEALTSKEIEYQDVIITGEGTIFYKGDQYVRIRDKFVSPEKREKLKKIAKADESGKGYYVSGSILLKPGLINDDYYVDLKVALQLKAQFESGGLYEVEADDR